MDLSGSSGSTKCLPLGATVSKLRRWARSGAQGRQGPSEISCTWVEEVSALGSPSPSPTWGPSPTAWAYTQGKTLPVSELNCTRGPKRTLLSMCPFFPDLEPEFGAPKMIIPWLLSQQLIVQLSHAKLLGLCWCNLTEWTGRGSLLIKKKKKKKAEKVLNTKKITKKIQLLWCPWEAAEGCYQSPTSLLSPLTLCALGDDQGPGDVVLSSCRTQKGLSPPHWRENKQQVASLGPSFAKFPLHSPRNLHLNLTFCPKPHI